MPAQTQPSDDAATPATGKGRPTPTRKEREALNKRPLVPTDRKAASKTDKAAARTQREREYQAMRSGDERYLPVKDRGPVRRFVRDSIDARWTLGEFFLPIALFMLAGQMVTASSAPAISVLTLVLLYVYILAMAVNAAVVWRKIKRQLATKFGAKGSERGLLTYALLRQFQLRPTRLPKPKVARGEFPSVD